VPTLLSRPPSALSVPLAGTQSPFWLIGHDAEAAAGVCFAGPRRWSRPRICQQRNGLVNGRRGAAPGPLSLWLQCHGSSCWRFASVRRSPGVRVVSLGAPESNLRRCTPPPLSPRRPTLPPLLCCVLSSQLLASRGLLLSVCDISSSHLHCGHLT
jgi:hypothetical protein